jgi:hypothetical protein
MKPVVSFLLVAAAIGMIVWGIFRLDSDRVPMPAPPVIVKPLFASLPVQIELRQRSTVEAPQADGNVKLAIDDITAGQVKVAVMRDDHPALLEPTSLREGERAIFECDGRRYEVTVDRLENNLMGEDFATLTIHAAGRESDESAAFASSGHSAKAPKVSTPPIASTMPAEVSGASAAPIDEAAEAAAIEGLIAHIGSLEGAVFVRNGEEHEAKEAAGHLRTKWQWKKDEIRTAEQFIEVVATKSSQSGELYTMRLADGSVVKVGDYLRARLGEGAASRPAK